MAIPEISIAQFNKIANGDYNAGFVDFAKDENGNVINELKKVNNHVVRKGLNKVELSPERILEVKEAFIRALERALVPQDRINEIRGILGIPKELDATGDGEQLRKIVRARFKPLARQHIRALLDKYANGIGFAPGAEAEYSQDDLRKIYRAGHMSKSRTKDRQAVNRANAEAAWKRADFRLTDAVSVLSTLRSFGELSEARQRRVSGAGPDADTLREASVRDLGSGVATLFSMALGLLQADAHETAEFTMMDTAVKLVKGDDGRLSAVVGGGVARTTVRLDATASELVDRLVGRAVQDQPAIGGAAVKEMLNAAYAADIRKGLMASDRTSLTRHFAALVLERQGTLEVPQEDEHLFRLADGNYNTGLLVQIAQRTLDGALAGQNVLDTRRKLDNYYKAMRQDTAKLPDDIKQMLEGVANVPIEAVEDGEFIVRAPIVGDIRNHVAAIPERNGPAPALPEDVSLDDVKNFVADFIFSDDTMVSDVVVNLPGEMMRRSLSDPKKLAAFAAILKNPALLDTATAPEIAGVLKEGFASLKQELEPSFLAATGVTLDQAALQDGFAETFAAFFRDADRLPGGVLAKFDDILDEMTTKACAKIQDFVNGIFDIRGEAGVNVVKNPYAEMQPDDIKADLDGKSLNQILDAAAQNSVPGQVGFFRQVVSTYFTSLEQSDKRSCLAAALRYAKTYDFAGIQPGEALDGAKQAAINKFAGAILKGAGPLLHKMMQGLPKDVMGPYADALEDMKQHLAPMPRKIVQAYLNQMIIDSHQRLKSVKLVKSLGAASVGEAFLCEFQVKRPGGAVGEDGQPIYDTKRAVVKIMRHDAERRIKKEREIFDAAAEKIPGMAQTWKGQWAQYEKEFDFETESDNIVTGYGLYDIKGHEDHDLNIIAPDVTTLEVSDLAPPKKNIIVLELMEGDTLDTYFKNAVGQIRNATSTVFEQDPVTGRIKWETHEDPVTHQPVKTPIPRQDIPAGAAPNLQIWLVNNRDNLTQASNKLLQATKAWFYNALLGNGKFHGDPHAGNLMINPVQIGFIDFGNLYQLKREREDGVNEQHELMRVILGAAFRDKKFILGAFDKLMSAEGKARLADETVRAKAEAILDSILSPTRGQFSFNIVYRLQACIVELQKLGLELPPQINCFIQSLVRLSNTVTEINTIVNQADALAETARNLDLPAPADRDELDYLGRACDAFASPAGRAKILSRSLPDGSLVPVGPDDPPQPGDRERPGWDVLLRSGAFGGANKITTTVFKPGQEYSGKVLARLDAAQDPAAEAEKLVATLEGHVDGAHNPFGTSFARQARTALATLRTALQAAGGDPGRRTAALRAFADAFATVEGKMVQLAETNFRTARAKEPPAAFVGAITDILFDNFTVLKDALGYIDGLAMYGNVHNIVNNELHVQVGYGDSDGIVDAIKQNAQGVRGDKDYTIDIGV